jgi:hypothetical protein
MEHPGVLYGHGWRDQHEAAAAQQMVSQLAAWGWRIVFVDGGYLETKEEGDNEAVEQIVQTLEKVFLSVDGVTRSLAEILPAGGVREPASKLVRAGVQSPD